MSDESVFFPLEAQYSKISPTNTRGEDDNLDHNMHSFRLVPFHVAASQLVVDSNSMLNDVLR